MAFFICGVCNMTEDLDIKYLLTGEWGLLWDRVRSTSIPEDTESLTPDMSEKLAVQAFLLSGHWSSSKLGREALKACQYSGSASQKQKFFMSLAVILLKNKVVISKTNFLSRDTEEFYFIVAKLRSVSTDLAMRDVGKVLAKMPTIGDHQIVALRFALEDPKVDLKALKRFVKKFATHPRLVSVIAVIRERLGLVITESYIRSTNPIAKHQALNRLFHRGKLHHVITGFDELLHDSRYVNLNSALTWLTTCVSTSHGLNGIDERIDKVIECSPPNSLVISSFATFGFIAAWVNRDLVKCHFYFERAADFIGESNISEELRNIAVFYRYLRLLCVEWQHKRENYVKQGAGVQGLKLFVVGESHSLSPANLVLTINERRFVACTKFVMGVKMFHLLDQRGRFYKSAVIEHLKETKCQGEKSVLFTIGEIDSRPNEGIWKNSYRIGKGYKEVVAETVRGYIRFLRLVTRKQGFQQVIIQGVPAPGYELAGQFDPTDSATFLEMIQFLNEALQAEALKAGFGFLDIYSATVDVDTKRGNGKWHIDTIHISPEFYQTLNDYLIFSKR